MSLRWQTLTFRGWAPDLDPTAGLVLLRGRIGRALKALGCVADPPCGYDDDRKRPCQLPTSCPYAALFEGLQSGSPSGNDECPPMVLTLDVQPGRGGDDVTLQATVVGWPRRLFPHLVLAIQEATRRRSKLLGGLPPFEWEDWGAESGSESSLDLPRNGVPRSVELDFRTPLRLLHQGRVVRAFDPAAFFPRLLARLDRLDRLYGQDDAPEGPVGRFAALDGLIQSIRVVSDGMSWHTHERFSQAQGQAQRLDGLVGRVVLDGVPPELRVPLSLGERFLVGRSTAMGCGRYRLSAR